MSIDVLNSPEYRIGNQKCNRSHGGWKKRDESSCDSLYNAGCRWEKGECLLREKAVKAMDHYLRSTSEERGVIRARGGGETEPLFSGQKGGLSGKSRRRMRSLKEKKRSKKRRSKKRKPTKPKKSKRRSRKHTRKSK